MEITCGEDSCLSGRFAGYFERKFMPLLVVFSLLYAVNLCEIHSMVQLNFTARNIHNEDFEEVRFINSCQQEK